MEKTLKLVRNGKLRVNTLLIILKKKFLKVLKQNK